jgi:serralysin
MGPILIALDKAWDYYQLASAPGRQPISYGPTTYQGRDTIAVVTDGGTCGAGCSYVGFTGTEITTTSFNTLYNDVNNNFVFDQVLFYEFGRNFWFYDGQLKYHSPPDVDPVATGFAVYMRFMSMDAAGVNGGPYNGFSFSFFRSQVVSLIDTYILTPSLNWTNTFKIGQAPSNTLGLGTTDMIASLLMRIERDFGKPGFATNFWKQVALRNVAFSTQGAVDNFILAASATTGKNLVGIFTNTWKFPVSAAAAQEAQQRWGAPFVLLPPMTFHALNGGKLALQWQSEVNTLYQLQSSPDLLTWTNVGLPVVGNSTIRSITTSISTNGAQYFRLKLE